MSRRFSLPVLPLRETVVYPGVAVPISAGRPGTVEAVQEAMDGDRRFSLRWRSRKTRTSPIHRSCIAVGTVVQDHSDPPGARRHPAAGAGRVEGTRRSVCRLRRRDAARDPRGPRALLPRRQAGPRASRRWTRNCSAARRGAGNPPRAVGGGAQPGHPGCGRTGSVRGSGRLLPRAPHRRKAAVARDARRRGTHEGGARGGRAGAGADRRPGGHPGQGPGGAGGTPARNAVARADETDPQGARRRGRPGGRRRVAGAHRAPCR